MVEGLEIPLWGGRRFVIGVEKPGVEAVKEQMISRITSAKTMEERGDAIISLIKGAEGREGEQKVAEVIATVSRDPETCLYDIYAIFGAVVGEEGKRKSSRILNDVNRNLRRQNQEALGDLVKQLAVIGDLPEDTSPEVLNRGIEKVIEYLGEL